jgi:hypothetical protein
MHLDHDVASGKFAKKLFGESEIEDVLHRLDRLTHEEAHMTGTETLQIIHGLMSNMKLVMGGTQPGIFSLLVAHRTVRTDGSTSMHDIWHALGMLVLQPVSARLIEDASYHARGNQQNKQEGTLVLRVPIVESSGLIPPLTRSSFSKRNPELALSTRSFRKPQYCL